MWLVLDRSAIYVLSLEPAHVCEGCGPAGTTAHNCAATYHGSPLPFRLVSEIPCDSIQYPQ